jgi:signal transduction histidine kinase
MKPGLDFSRPAGWWLATLCSGLLPALAQPVSLPETMVLTNAAQVHALTPEEAARGLPVRLRGVMVGEADPGWASFAMQDATGGMYVGSTRETISRIHTGDLIEVKGVTDPGEYSPFVAAQSVRKTGTAELPEPRRVTFDEMASGKLDAQWVEVRGIVRYCEPVPGAGKCRIELATGGGRLVVRWNVPEVKTPMVDAEVRLRGVCYYLFNRNRQYLSPMLAIPRDVPVTVEVPPPVDPFATPVRSVSSLMQFAPNDPHGHRVHVRGVVICQQPGEALWLRDGERGLRVITRQTDELSPGDEVDVLGFPKQGEYTPILEDAIFQAGSVRNPAPAPLFLAGGAEAFNHDADLVELEATLSAREPVPGGWVFALNAADDTKFNALLRTPPGEPAPEDSLPDSCVRVAGVCSVFRDYTGYVSGLSRPRTFQLLLRSRDDLSVIQPAPWWTRQHVTWLLGGVAALLLLAVAGVVAAARWRLRKQAAERRLAEREFAAVLSERNRMAREIHDTLTQGLVATLVQLRLVKKHANGGSAPFSRHLEAAQQMLSDSLDEARNTIWNVRSQVLETGDLAKALGDILKHLTDGTDVEACVRVTGKPRRLAPVIENNLLRVGQEAITNAAKHAAAKKITVELDFGDNRLHLAVQDDGRGFDTSRPPVCRSGFGLVGMRERAAELKGELNILSASNRGTAITLSVPLTEEDTRIA